MSGGKLESLVLRLPEVLLEQVRELEALTRVRRSVWLRDAVALARGGELARTWEWHGAAAEGGTSVHVLVPPEHLEDLQRAAGLFRCSQAALVRDGLSRVLELNGRPFTVGGVQA